MKLLMITCRNIVEGSLSQNHGKLTSGCTTVKRISSLPASAKHLYIFHRGQCSESCSPCPVNVKCHYVFVGRWGLVSPSTIP